MADTGTRESTAALLRRAAEKLRDQAYRASRGPWHAVQREGTFPHELVVAVERRWERNPDEPDDPGVDDVSSMPVDTGGFQFVKHEAIADGDYIAMMHPPVALALAEWLESAAFLSDGPTRGVDSINYALHVARAVLREEPTPCPQCGPGYRYGDEGCRHTSAEEPTP